MRILISGGHLMPAVAVVDKLLSQKRPVAIEIFFAGRQYNLDDEQSYSLEYKEISQRKIKFIPFVTGRLKREISFKSLKNLLLILVGLKNSLAIIGLVKPDIILSFGGYLGFPFVFWGWLKKIPIYVHEQTLHPGSANRLSGYFAKKIFVSFPQAKKYFSSEKVQVTGNPVRKNIFLIDKKPFLIKKDRPVIYVTGGSLGSHSLNVHLGEILKRLLTDYIVIHQTGSVKEYNDYELLKKLKQQLPLAMQKNYYLREHFFSDEIGYIFFISDLIIGRSGANIFFELIALKKPAILVPLPWSVNQEQQKQAELFASQGLGEIFSQFEKSDSLLALIKHVFKKLDQYRNNFDRLQSLYKHDAAEEIIKTIFSQ